MSEQSKPYVVRSSNPLAQVEPEADYYRKVLRGIQHRCRTYQEEGRSTDELETIMLVAQEALARPRSNDEAIDRLEREVGDLQSRLLDQDVLQMEKGQAEAVAAEATNQLAGLRAELQQLHDRLGGRFANLAHRVGGWVDQKLAK